MFVHGVKRAARACGLSVHGMHQQVRACCAVRWAALLQ
jgi:hypothetical protein